MTAICTWTEVGKDHIRVDFPEGHSPEPDYLPGSEESQKLGCTCPPSEQKPPRSLVYHLKCPAHEIGWSPLPQ